MSKIKLLSIAVVGLLIINSLMLGLGFWNGSKRPPLKYPPGRPTEPKQIIIDNLHLTGNQITAYENLIRDHRSSVIALENDIKQTKNRLYRTLQEEESPAKDSLENRLGELQKQIEITHYEHFHAIKKLCRPDQLPLFNALSEELARLFAPQKNMRPPPRD